MLKKPKTRESLEVMLASCSDPLFPEGMGEARVTLNSRDVSGLSEFGRSPRDLAEELGGKARRLFKTAKGA
ncbi:hypothetical protein SAMN04488002_2743 [Litoreibacter janthinus]|uniref:Uncharacterized protein n=1 Tax=Litoreibacter janthinus TaxID=670154 RepID=A0A1I6HA95_9RHOB|nr:hypothetical protein SAMN04488002_2743 [Litoreibacter janthinus]